MSDPTTSATEGDRVDLRAPLPITVIAGFLGAGKTTLINGLIGHLNDRRLAVVVNDFGAIDIDGRLVAAVHDDVVTLTNGCICCTIRDGVGSTVLELAERPTPPEHVVVEASGVSEPGALAEVFIELQRAGFVRVDGLVTVVDADAFDVSDPQQAGIARRQVAQADLLVLSKLDLVTPERKRQVIDAVEAINPAARVVDRDACTPAVLLGLRDADVFASETPGHLHSPEVPDFRTAHVRFDAPVSFKPLFDALRALPAAVYRAKGWLDLVERPGDKILFHLVGRRIHVRTIGRWADDPADPPRTELVFIGRPEGWSASALQATLTEATGGPPGGPVPDQVDARRGGE